MSRASSLLELQNVEQELRKRITSYKKVQKQLSKFSKVEKARQTYEKKIDSEKLAQARQNQISLELQGLIEKVKGAEQELYSGRVKNPKELTNLQLEIDNLKTRRDKLEEETLSLIEQVDSLSQQTTKAKNNYEKVQEITKTRQEALEKREHALKRHISKVRRVQLKILADIDASDLELYRYVQRKKNDRIAIAELKSGVCTACHIETSSAKRNQIERASKDKLLTCGNCGRILVA